ncbi:tetratricopeptide repeat protein [Actinokineospora sp. PR83]|uniref:AfsR/SARP family transcriptional regulator n=1 Tax=Actinokineospora sp. PR83 TaxID=2884908 RepID=UPI0027DEE725|nr:BTAD domain-containing putative transcriptional regulator [Actinokineospora sp. PR83]MCG8915742.1 tetratricopeptide repeat protein [Actinokineospora sp. PR83]
MRVQVLGAVRAWSGTDEVNIGSPGRRALLTLLALADGRPLGMDGLIGALWGERSPRSAVNVVHTHVKHLRRVLEPARQPGSPARVLVRCGDGYALRLPDEALDLAQFRRLAASGAALCRAGEHRAATARLTSALELWAGPPGGGLAALAGNPAVTAAVREWLSAVLAHGEAALAAGEPAVAVPLLSRATAEAPLDESLHALLIRAHHATGDRSAAAAAFHRVRKGLAAELGLDPGPELTAAYSEVLAGRPAAAARVVAVVPKQLPPACGSFVLRDEVLAELDAVVADGDRGVPVAVVDGTAGVGKTTVVVHWAHGVADRFPDGQLFVDLRGFGPGAPLDPADVLAGFTEVLGVPAGASSDLAARTGLFRSLLAGKRVLVVLDNARDADQVRPLLPGTAGCAAVVTSRSRLPGLLVGGARAVAVDLLAPAEAREMLAGRLGSTRVAAEPEATERVIAACAGLPLALAVAAARATTTPLGDVVADLDEAGSLDALATGEPHSDIRVAFETSHRAVAEPAAGLLDLLGLHPLPELPLAAATALAGTPTTATRRCLRTLADARLVDDRGHGRFRLHDLLHDYARERAAELPARAAAAALDRLLDHYLHSTRAAARTFSPYTDTREVPAPAPGSEPLDFTDRAAATAWFAVEQEALVALVGTAEAAGRDRHVCELAVAQRFWLDRRGRWECMRALGEVALAAADRLGDPWLRGRCHRELVTAHMRLARWADGEHHLAAALRLLDEAADPVAYGQTLVNGAQMRRKQGRVEEALHDARTGLGLLVEAGHNGQALALSLVGSLLSQTGAHVEALAAHERALHLQRQLGYRFGEADTLLAMGTVRHTTGDNEGARACHRRAVELFSEAGDRFCVADSLLRLGDDEHALGHTADARANWEQSLGILTGLRNPLADTARLRLSETGG